MRHTAIVRVVLVASWLGMMVVPAAGQTLADVARQEAERRKTIESGRTFTSGDLRQERPAPERARVAPAETPPPASAGSGAAPSAAAETRDAESSAEKEVPVKAREKRDEQYWRTRTADYDTRLTRIRNDIAAMQGRLDTIAEKLDAVRTSTERRLLQRERAEVTSVLAEFRQNLGFLESEYDGYRQWAASKDVELDRVR